MWLLKHTQHCGRVAVVICSRELSTSLHLDELPMIENVITILRKCRGNQDVEFLQGVYTYICCTGLEVHKNVGNHIVPLFAECGGLWNMGQCAFNRMTHHNVHSWNSLISGFAKSGHLEHALHLYQKMQEAEVRPSSHTLVALLKSCGDVGLEGGRVSHCEVICQGLEIDIFVGSSLVGVYSKSGSLPDARAVFDKMPVRDVVSWNVLMSAYADQGFSNETLFYFESMQTEGVPPDSVSYICILKACGCIAAIDKGRIRHLEIIEGFVKDSFVSNALVDMYIKCGFLAEAQQVFDMLPFRDVVSWNALMAGYAEHGPHWKALNCFKEMQEEGIVHDAVSFACVLKACSISGELKKGREIHSEAILKGCEGEIDVGNCIVAMYAHGDLFIEAQIVFDQLPVQMAASWHALIEGYEEQGHWQGLLRLYQHMQLEGVLSSAAMYVCGLKVCASLGAKGMGRKLFTEIVQKGHEREVSIGKELVHMYAEFGLLSEARVILDTLWVGNVTAIWNALLTECIEHGRDLDALCYFELMQGRGIVPTAATFVCGLQACGCVRAVCKGQCLHEEIVILGLEKDMFIGNTVVDMYAKSGLFADAQSSFNKLAVKDVVTWNALLSGYSDHGGSQEVLKYYEQMQMEGVSQDGVTLVCVLKACGNRRALDKGQELHSEVIKKGLEGDVFVGNVLIFMYAKCNSCLAARNVFDKMCTHNVVSWNTLLEGYVNCGFDEEAVKYFKCMPMKTVVPNAGTFVCVLKAYGALEALNRGQCLHNEIVQKGLEDDILIGNMLVDMYARSGSLAMAQCIFNMLPVQNVVSWTTLITGYSQHGPISKVLLCFEQMQLDGVPPDAGICACVLKACGSIGAIDKIHTLHNEATIRGFEKDPSIGSTLVSIYAKWVSVMDAREVSNKLEARNIISWTGLIVGYVEHGPYEEALQCFTQMQLEGMVPDAPLYACALGACSNTGAIHKGQLLHLETAQKGYETDLFVSSSLIHMYAKCSCLDEACDTFDKLPAKNVVSWSAMIKGFGMNREGAMALQCFEDMQENGVAPNAVTFSNLLSTCSRASLVPKGQDYFRLLKDCNYVVVPHSDHLTSMICLLSRAGYLDEARHFLESIPCNPSNDMWIALLTSCQVYLEGKLGLQCFEQLG